MWLFVAAVLLFIFSESVKGECNYIDFGSYATPENVCVEDIWGTASMAFTYSHIYQCNDTNEEIMNRPKWNCFYNNNPYYSKCGFEYCPSWKDPDKIEHVGIGDFGIDSTEIINIYCNSNISIISSCDYVRVKYYDQPSYDDWDGNTIPIVTNLCINKKIFGCNDTNYWRIDYVDDECQQPKLLYFYPLSDVYPKIEVEECSWNTTAPTDIPLTTAAPTSAPTESGNGCIRCSLLLLTVLVVILALCS